MKKLYAFTLHKNSEIEEVQISKGADGKEVKTLVKVNKKEPLNYFFAKPTRVLSEAADLEYNKIFWKCQKEGIMPLTQLQKRFVDDGGVLSKDEVKWREESYETFWTKQAEYQELYKKTSRTPEEEVALKVLLDEIGQIWTDLQQFEESKGSNLYQNTAESVAKNRQTLWWTVHLAYQDLGNDKVKSVFGDGSYEDRLKAYDSYNEGDDVFNADLAQRFFFITSIWNFGKAQTQEEFDIAIKTAENRNLINAVETIAQNAEVPAETNIKEEVKLEVKETVKEIGKEVVSAT
jgi:hypothetical protein